MTTKRATEARPKKLACKVEGATIVRTYFTEDDRKTLHDILAGVAQTHYVTPSVAMFLRGAMQALTELYAADPEKAFKLILEGARS